MGDISIGGHDFFLVRQPGGGITNSWREEDASPTAVQAAENAPDAANVPVAATEYTNWQGSIGLYERDQQPADFSRMFVSDWDSSRPMQVSSWVRWPGDQVAMVGGGGAPVTTGSADPATRAFAIVDTSIVSRFACNGYSYSWDGTQFNNNWTPDSLPGYGANALSPPLFASQYIAPPPQIIYPTATDMWMYDNAGKFRNLATNSTSAAIPGGMAVLFYDFWATFVIGAGYNYDITVTAYRPAGPTGTAVQTAQLPTSGIWTSVYNAANVTSSIPGIIRGERAIAGMVASEGVVWVATDHSVYALQWNDTYNTWLIDKLFQVPRITGAPVAWNGEIYIPAEGALAHIIPGQKGYDWRKPDQFDTMPVPFNGWITQCIPTPDALYCKVVEAQDQSTGTTRGAILRLDTSGAWSCVVVDESTTSLLGMLPLINVVDRTNPPGIGYFTDAFHIRLLPAKSAGRNPRTLAVSQRPQAALVRGIGPWETGTARANQKQLLRYRIEVEDCVGKNVNVYYQFPADAYPGVADTFTSGAGVGTGGWHKCGVVTANTVGHSGAIDANGNGWVWVEFDGVTSYSGGVGVLPLYPDYTAVRWCIEIEGDTTGTHAPLVRKFRFDREEYISKVKVLTAYIDLQAGMRRRGSLDDTFGATDAQRDAAWVTGELAFIQSMVSGKRAQTVVTPKGETFPVEITKWVEALDGFDDEGVQGAKVTLSMKVIPLLGVL